MKQKMSLMSDLLKLICSLPRVANKTELISYRCAHQSVTLTMCLLSIRQGKGVSARGGAEADSQ